MGEKSELLAALSALCHAWEGKHSSPPKRRGMFLFGYFLACRKRIVEQKLPLLPAFAPPSAIDKTGRQVQPLQQLIVVGERIVQRTEAVH
ncbi:hypothetical protein [Geobacillus jurassicus]|uniref:Uncharacterized protein n=1 Tax=Geobacillus jurassicus TaxID=235932 RepID=A0ABV6GR52_9BACL|nr:hypothetical protein [Geobacillus jurassicus]